MMIDPKSALRLIEEEVPDNNVIDSDVFGPCGGHWTVIVRDDVLCVWGTCLDDMGQPVDRFKYQWKLTPIE